METFSLLKYWSAAKTSTPTPASPAAAAAVSAAASSTDSDVVDVELDGSFFDLDFSTSCLPAKQQIQLLTISNSFSSNSSDVDILIATPSSEPNSLLLKSATKLRVFALGFRKLKSDSDSNPIVSPKSNSSSSFKFFASSRKTKNHNSNDDGGEEKKLSKEAQSPVLVRKYISSRMIKPLYVRVSRRYNGVGGEVRTKMMGFSGPLTSSPTAKAAAAMVSKSKSPVEQPPPVHHEEDGIQSAIAHCKRCSSQELETLPVQPRTGGEEGKE